MPPLTELLASRPGTWALVAEAVNAPAAVLRTPDYQPLEDEERIEVELRPVDDGEHGVLYDVYARTKILELANPTASTTDE